MIPRSALRVSTVTVIAAAVSAAMYGLVYGAEGAIFRNGLTLAIPDARPADPSALALQLGAYLAGMVLLLAVYGWMIATSRRSPETWSERERRGFFVFPIAAHVAFLFARPYDSFDLWSYIVGGATENPYVTPLKAMAGSAVGRRVAELGWRPVHGPSPYGPVWIWWEMLVAKIDDPRLAATVMKIPIVVASLVSAWLIHRILSRVRPEARLLGTTLYLWNPLVLFELAAEGHNDALMIAFTLASVLLAVSHRPVASVFALGLAMLSKLVPLLFVPVLVIHQWHTSRDRRRLLLQWLAGAALVAATAACLYAPLWAGIHTFDGVVETATAAHAASFREALVQILALVWPSDGAALGLRIAPPIALVAFAILAGLATWRARTDDRLLTSAGAIAAAYVLVGSAVYWPWYATLAVGLLALSPQRTFAVVFVTSVCACLVAPVNNLRANRFVSWDTQWGITAFVGCVVPLFAWIVVAHLRRRAVVAGRSLPDARQEGRAKTSG